MITHETISKNFDDFSIILSEHAKFLISIEDNLTELYKNNPEIFRRNPFGRPKSTESIIRKLNTYKVEKEKLLDGLKSIEDIVGTRLTIASQDQYEKAGKLIIKSLESLGETRLKKRWRWNSAIEEEQTKTGYCADHYVISKKNNPDVKCEIQIRTLTHDLWAVFSHPESYKVEEKLNVSREDEIKNYARLMDASDYYVKLIKSRKIEEANEYNKERIGKGEGTILTVESLESILFENPMIKSAGKVDVIKICEYLKELSDYRIHTVEDVNKVLLNEPFKKALINSINEVNKESNTNYMDMAILDVLSIAYRCRASNKIYFDEGEMTTEMKNTIKGKVRNWHLEKDLEAKIKGDTYVNDGKPNS